MLKLLICDWDGTVVNSVKQIVKCKKHLAKKYQLPSPAEATIRAVLGRDFKEAMATCFPTATPYQLNHLCDEFHCLMQSPEFQAPLFPNAMAILEQLKNDGIQLAVATSKSRDELNHALESLSLKTLFDITCCAEEYQPKPSPIMLQSICKQLSVSPQQSLMLGDTVSDILCAQNANIKIVCVSFGAQSQKKLAAYSPDNFINDWQALPATFDKLTWN